MEEVRIEIRVRNNVLYHAIYDSYASVAAFSRQYGLHQTYILDLINLKKSPIGKKGKWLAFCIRLSEILKINIDLLFPLRLYQLESPKRTVELSLHELSTGELSQLKSLPAVSGPYLEMVEQELEQTIEKALAEFSPKEQEMLRLRFGFNSEQREYLYEEIGDKFNVSGERVRQIVAKILRKLRWQSQNPDKATLRKTLKELYLEREEILSQA
jgi:RNA polymerase sigma factor (sigma-70 family)